MCARNSGSTSSHDRATLARTDSARSCGVIESNSSTVTTRSLPIRRGYSEPAMAVVRELSVEE